MTCHHEFTEDYPETDDLPDELWTTGEHCILCGEVRSYSPLGGWGRWLRVV